MTDEDRLVGIKEASQITGYSEATISLYVKEGRIPAQKDGDLITSPWKIKESDLVGIGKTGGKSPPKPKETLEETYVRNLNNRGKRGRAPLPQTESELTSGLQDIVDHVKLLDTMVRNHILALNQWVKDREKIIREEAIADVRERIEKEIWAEILRKAKV